MKRTKVTKIPRATEKKRRYDDAIRWLRDASRNHLEREFNLEAAAFDFAADELEAASD